MTTEKLERELLRNEGRTQREREREREEEEEEGRGLGRRGRTVKSTSMKQIPGYDLTPQLVSRYEMQGPDQKKKEKSKKVLTLAEDAQRALM